MQQIYLQCEVAWTGTVMHRDVLVPLLCYFYLLLNLQLPSFRLWTKNFPAMFFVVSLCNLEIENENIETMNDCFEQAWMSELFACKSDTHVMRKELWDRQETNITCR